MMSRQSLADEDDLRAFFNSATGRTFGDETGMFSPTHQLYRLAYTVDATLKGRVDILIATRFG